MTKTLRALRGAITLEADTRDQVMERVSTLIEAMVERNGVEVDDMVSLIFTATEDITAEFPAAAARAMGISQVPLLCARELSVQDAIPLCIRVLMHLHTDRTPDRLRHVYLEGARPLRTDLPQ